MEKRCVYPFDYISDGRILLRGVSVGSWDEKFQDLGVFIDSACKNSKKTIEARAENLGPCGANCAFNVIPYRFSLRISHKSIAEGLHVLVVSASLRDAVFPEKSHSFFSEYIIDPERMLILSENRFFLPKGSGKLIREGRELLYDEGCAVLNTKKGHCLIGVEALSRKYGKIFPKVQN